MSIVAALDKVLFFNASSKYSVLRMKTEDSSVPTEARSPYRYHDHLIRFTAVGIELPQTDTVKIEMDGEWKDGKYGLQLQVDHWQEIVPPTLEGVRNYLASGLLKGIGEKTADAIIEKFGVNALEILEHQPDRLLEIRGITKERLAEIKDAYAETSRMRVLMTLLAPFKVTPTTAQKIYQHFGPACADIVRQSPFNLCQVPGFGFMPQKAQEVPSETAEPAVTERAETAQMVNPVVVDMPAAASTAAAPKYSDDMTVDEILSLMAEEEAAELVVTTGVNKGWTMAQVSEQRPSSLKYYAYLCEDCGNIMKAAAMLLMGGSQQLKAS